MMKRKVILGLWVLFAALPTFAQTDSAFKTPNYKQRVASFMQEQAPKNHIVFLGNSITEVGKWQQLIPNKKVLNRGISGDVTAGVLARIDQCALAKPKQIFIMTGINDLKIGKPLAYITANQIAIIKRIKQLSPKTKIVMQSTLPVNEGMLAAIYKRLNNKAINEMNVALQNACKEMGVTYVDLHPVLTDEKGQLQQELSTDGLHLKPAAYEKWVALLQSKKLL